ncbi:MAG: hypothetical protein NTY38_12115 [Acidobacteria bacterium]|nr:hypothetical protein [Acidobacteriota bacterium]
MDDQIQLLARVEDILRPYYDQIAADQARFVEGGTVRMSKVEWAAVAEDMRIKAGVWAAQALLAVLTNHNVVPVEPEAFGVLQDRLVHRLAADAAEYFSMSGFPGVSDYRDEIRVRLLEQLPGIAERPRSVNRRRYLGDASLPDDVPSRTPDLVRPLRTPDLATSRERIALVNVLARELATIKQDLKRFCTGEDLKQKHPQFVLWKHIDKAELKDLTDGAAFTPKAYAEYLTLREFGIISRETLKKDRKKLRQAQKAKRP